MTEGNVELDDNTFEMLVHIVSLMVNDYLNSQVLEREENKNGMWDTNW